MKLMKVTVFVIIFVLIYSSNSYSYDYESAQEAAYKAIAGTVYFPLDPVRETNCGFYCYRAPTTGNWHGANDYTGYHGEPIQAIRDGVVIRTDSGWGNTYLDRIYVGGNMVVIQHTPNFTSSYSHLIKPLVRVSDRVRVGDIVGKMDNSGYSTGTHVHLSLRYQNVPVDPNHKTMPLWAGGHNPIPASKAGISRATDKAIRRAAQVYEDIYPLEPGFSNPFTDVNEFRVIRSSIKNDDTNISPVEHIYIRFSRPVDINEVRRHIGLEPRMVVRKGIVDYPHQNDQCVVRIWGIMFNANQNYRLELNNLPSLNGENLKHWQIKFRTGDWPITPFDGPTRNLVIHKDRIRLGNNKYEGEINSKFSAKSQDTKWKKSFEIDCAPPVIILRYNSRGVEMTRCQINGNNDHLFWLPSNNKYDNGKKKTLKLPGNIFKRGVNTVEILPQLNNWGDLDDIEIWNLELLY
jgi:hypothetical protein